VEVTKEKKEQELKLPASVTNDQLEAWKKENKNGIALIQSEGFTAVLRRPTRDDMRELTAKQSGLDPVTFTEVVLDQLWLGGDEEIRTDDPIFFGAMTEIQNILDAKEATLVKL
jgi:hypothetical protein